MKSDEHNFEELTAPGATAKELGISVATLRKYSLIVEKITGNKDYYERNSQRARLYRKQDIKDIDAFHQLAQNNGLTLQEAARQVFAVSAKQKPKTKTEVQNESQQELPADSAQAVKLLTALKQTISQQNEAIASLNKRLDQVEKQNQALIEQQKQLAAPQETATELPDYSALEFDADESEPEPTQAQKRAAVVEDEAKSGEELHREIINKAKENAAKRAKENVHRTLEDMQLDSTKKHWWQRFINF